MSRGPEHIVISRGYVSISVFDAKYVLAARPVNPMNTG